MNDEREEYKFDHFKNIDEVMYYFNYWYKEEDVYSINRYLSLKDFNYISNKYQELQQENQKLKKQLEYLRSGEYYNQLRFENKMLQDIVDNGEVSKEDREFIDCTHRNTELLEQQEEFINYMMNTIENITQDENDDEEIKGYLIQRGNTFKEILSKYREIRR